MPNHTGTQQEPVVMLIIHRPPLSLSLSLWVRDTNTEWSEMVHLIPDGVCFRMSNICPAEQLFPNSGGRIQLATDPERLTH